VQVEEGRARGGDSAAFLPPREPPPSLEPLFLEGLKALADDGRMDEAMDDDETVSHPAAPAAPAAASSAVPGEGSPLPPPLVVQMTRRYRDKHVTHVAVKPGAAADNALFSAPPDT